jgi:hypothetical protein
MRKALNSPLVFAIEGMLGIWLTLAAFPVFNPVIEGIAVYALGYFAYRWKKNDNARTRSTSQ